MNSFRLRSFKSENSILSTKEIKLVDNFNEDGNYYTLIIGNNGTGKSRLLSSIVRYFNDNYKNKNFSRSLLFDFSGFPEKLIALTNSISDKFPIDYSFGNNKEILYNKKFYTYLGNRSRANSFSTSSLINKALDITFENYMEKDISKSYRHIFDYLGYEPVIKITYKFSLNKIKGIENSRITINNLNNYLDKISYGSFGPPSRIKRILDKGNEELNKLVFFLNDLLHNEYNNNYNELLINFSESNINKLEHENSIYIDNYEHYQNLKILKDLRIIRAYDTNVFKKNGGTFNFKEASSGEANILSSFLGLIPVLKNNSLIVIDEPEISLHPAWQSKYIDLLKNVFNDYTGCHIIIASHSPFLVSDLPIGSSSVISIKNNKGVISSDIIEGSTFGWSAEDILLNVFELASTRNYYLSQIISDGLELIASNRIDSDIFKQIKFKLSKLYISMKDNDPLKKVVKIILNK